MEDGFWPIEDGTNLEKLDGCDASCPFVAQVDALVNLWSTNQYRLLPGGGGAGQIMATPAVPDPPIV